MEEEGRKEIEQGIKSRGWKVYGTDKSSKMVLDTEDNYLMAQLKHAEKDRVSSLEDTLAAEDTLYTYTRALCKILNIGRDAGEGQATRISEGFKVSFSGVPAATGTRKDHKKDWDASEEPATRPIVNAKLGPNSGLGSMISHTIRPLRIEAIKKQGTEVISTEKLLRSIEDLNADSERLGVRGGTEKGANGADNSSTTGEGTSTATGTLRKRLPRSCKQKPLQGKTLVVGSLDIKSLYPNCRSGPMPKH